MQKIIDVGNVSLKVTYEIEGSETIITSMHLFSGELLELLEYIEDYIECDSLIDYITEKIEED